MAVLVSFLTAKVDLVEIRLNEINEIDRNWQLTCQSQSNLVIQGQFFFEFLMTNSLQEIISSPKSTTNPKCKDINLQFLTNVDGLKTIFLN